MTRDEEDEAINAVTLISRGELSFLGPAFARAWLLEKSPCFTDLLDAIDCAGGELERENRLQLPSEGQIPE